jgi:hypothetical protein
MTQQQVQSIVRIAHLDLSCTFPINPPDSNNWCGQHATSLVMPVTSASRFSARCSQHEGLLPADSGNIDREVVREIPADLAYMNGWLGS